MYYWEENYQNIWDYAPKKKIAGSANKKGQPKCICQETALTKELDKLVNEFDRLTSSEVVSVIRTALRDEICCCSRNYCRHKDPQIPADEMNDDLWDLYTFFLNEFNTIEHSKTEDNENSSQDSTIPNDTKDIPESEKSPEAVDSSAKNDTENKSDKENLIANSEKSEENFIHWDPHFEVKIMETVAECMKTHDIHRYYLLQHIKILVACFRSNTYIPHGHTREIVPMDNS